MRSAHPREIRCLIRVFQQGTACEERRQVRRHGCAAQAEEASDMRPVTQPNQCYENLEGLTQARGLVLGFLLIAFGRQQ